LFKEIKGVYLDFFGIEQYPFSLTPNTEFYCNLPGHQAAFNVLLFSLKSGEGFIKIVGEVGSGKTLLCRKLLDVLDDRFVTAYIPNPDLSPHEFRKTFARELGIDIPVSIGDSDLSQAILERLLDLHAAGKRVVLLVDEAQALSDETLETLRLLTNLETEFEKLIQIVLFGQPELNRRLKQHRFRQLNQRITFAHKLQPLTRQNLEDYLAYRLAIAGHRKGPLFDRHAHDLIFESSGGIPRIINILTHKAMLAAYGRGDHRISKKAVKMAIKDSKDFIKKRQRIVRHTIWSITVGVIVFMIVLFVYLGATQRIVIQF